MESFKSALPKELVQALSGDRFVPDYWDLRTGESLELRMRLLECLDSPSGWGLALEFVRDHSVPRKLAERILEVAEVPLIVPEGAMKALGLGEEDSSPLDYPVFLDTPCGSSEERLWRHCNKPIVAVQLSDGSWEWQGATY